MGLFLNILEKFLEKHEDEILKAVQTNFWAGGKYEQRDKSNAAGRQGHCHGNDAGVLCISGSAEQRIG